MSWHYLQEQEAASWEGSSLDGAPSALLNLMPMREVSCSPGKRTDALNASRSGMTSLRSTGPNGVGTSMSSAEDSPVKTSASLGAGRASRGARADCGATWPASLARYDPDTHSWKTPQPLSIADWTEFSVIWPRWGTMLRGVCFPLPMLAHSTAVRGSGSLPTPTRYGNGGTGGTKKMAALGMFRTKLNPNHQEWLMLWPQGWTALTALETARFQQWLAWHGKH